MITARTKFQAKEVSWNKFH